MNTWILVINTVRCTDVAIHEVAYIQTVQRDMEICLSILFLHTFTRNKKLILLIIKGKRVNTEAICYLCRKLICIGYTFLNRQ